MKMMLAYVLDSFSATPDVSQEDEGHVEKVDDYDDDDGYIFFSA